MSLRKVSFTCIQFLIFGCRTIVSTQRKGGQSANLGQGATKVSELQTFAQMMCNLEAKSWQPAGGNVHSHALTGGFVPSWERGQLMASRAVIRKPRTRQRALNMTRLSPHQGLYQGLTIIPLFPTIKCTKGFPKRKIVFQSPPVNFHDCWREGICVFRKICALPSSCGNASRVPRPLPTLKALRIASKRDGRACGLDVGRPLDVHSIR